MHVTSLPPARPSGIETATRRNRATPAAVFVFWTLLGVALALLAATLTVWLLQEVILTAEGLTIIQPWRRSPVELAWGEIIVLDHSTNWMLLRFRAGRSVRCVGPALLRGPERVRMLAFINHYCLERGVLNYPHRWPFF